MEIGLPPLTMRPLPMASDDPVRGPDPAGTPPLAGRILFAEPHAVPVTPEFAASDPELELFVRQEAAHSVYHLVRLAIGFTAEPPTPRLESASVHLTLSSPGASVQPVAWSMTPVRVTEQRERQRTLTLSPQILFGGVEWSTTTTVPDGDTFLLAVGGRTAEPRWDLRRTRTMPLAGDQPLSLIVKAPRGATTSITATVRASTKSALLRRYRALTGPLTLVSAL
ncbi:hypothetical protein [Streptomyces sp. NBC_01803]|uniref:hypothetical protein n=1 Tax=Streptomyces sp. NBC_01803 TaxID=2975946 RepID=UPI002DD8A6EF|nr:hypothetical protein [Streptomyces sp. NBC_01803]WSA44244.1 hypothetical protein OIE51_08500 [Streptomyces sp. NBC_01803]